MTNAECTVKEISHRLTEFIAAKKEYTDAVINETLVLTLEQELLNTQTLIKRYCAFLNKSPTIQQRHHWLTKLT